MWRCCGHPSQEASGWTTRHRASNSKRADCRPLLRESANPVVVHHIPVSTPPLDPSAPGAQASSFVQPYPRFSLKPLAPSASINVDVQGPQFRTTVQRPKVHRPQFNDQSFNNLSTTRSNDHVQTSSSGASVQGPRVKTTFSGRIERPRSTVKRQGKSQATRRASGLTTEPPGAPRGFLLTQPPTARPTPGKEDKGEGVTMRYTA
jgi:hypothetical protein